MTDTVGSITTDEPDAGDGYDAFLSSLDDEDPKKGAPSETVEEAAESPVTETAEETEQTDEGEPNEGSETDENDPDNEEVEIKVGEETKKATLKELKRLFGQEASLTQKSQKLAEQSRVAQEQDARANAALTAMLERAKERYKPYAELDMLVLAQRMDTETFAQLRADAKAAEADVTFLTQELDGHMKAAQDRANKAHQEAGNAMIKALEDPKTGIEGFNPALYNELVAFGAANGLQNVRMLVDPNAIKVLHMAMLYDKGQKAAKTVVDKTRKVVAKPTRQLRPGNSASNQASAFTTAMKQLRSSGGDIDSAADAFAASFDR